MGERRRRFEFCRHVYNQQPFGVEKGRIANNQIKALSDPGWLLQIEVLKTRQRRKAGINIQNRHIGVAVAGLVNFLSPDRIVLGGGLVEAIPDLFMSTIEVTANENALPSYRGTFEVVVAKLGDDAAAMGAAAWIQHQLGFDTPAA